MSLLNCRKRISSVRIFSICWQAISCKTRIHTTLRVGFSRDYIDDNKQRFEVIILPQTLTQPALQLAHEGLGHNGIPWTYGLVEGDSIIGKV